MLLTFVTGSYHEAASVGGLLLLAPFPCQTIPFDNEGWPF